MALSCDKDPSMRASAPFEAKAPPVIPAITLEQEKPFSLDKPRLVDEVGSIDWAAFVQRSRLTPDTPPVVELHGFAAYHKAGGIFSEDLYEIIMAGVIQLQEAGEREIINFRRPTMLQVEDFAYFHNNPLGHEGPLPKGQQIALTQEEKDAYCLLREGWYINPPGENTQDANNPAMLSDQAIIREVWKMSFLRPQKILQKEEKSQTLTQAA